MYTPPMSGNLLEETQTRGVTDTKQTKGRVHVSFPRAVLLFSARCRWWRGREFGDSLSCLDVYFTGFLEISESSAQTSSSTSSPS